MPHVRSSRHPSMCVQVNPTFRVVTFSDSSLRRIHLSALAPLSSALAHIGQQVTGGDAIIGLSSGAHVVISPKKALVLAAFGEDHSGSLLDEYDAQEAQDEE